MLNARDLEKIQQLLEDQRLDGWLLFDFRGRNPIASGVLGDSIVGTRRVFVIIPRKGLPTAIVHEIDQELWQRWPGTWKKCVWVRERELKDLLAFHLRGMRLAVDFSPQGRIPYLDCMPAGVFDHLEGIASNLVSSEELVTRFLSVWTEDERRSHERAAEKVADIARVAVERVARTAREGVLTEFDIYEWIREAFRREGLVAEGGPSVCIGKNAARNHYEPARETAAQIVPGELLLIDLWAKEPGGIYADQTWMAVLGPPTDCDATLWEVVRTARDEALNLIRSGKILTGAEVDAAARTVISVAGWESHIASRTGHSIDRSGLHGFGPNIDSTETEDRRLLIPGIGFSIEPGIYVRGLRGVRSEVNVYLVPGNAVVTPRNYQKELWVL